MRKGRILQTIAAVGLALAYICTPAADAGAQSLALEFKVGGAVSSMTNSYCTGNTHREIKAGPMAGAGLGLIMPNEMLRIYAECYYSSKGEKYAMEDGSGTLETDVCYFHLYPNARFYTPYIPIYVGGGLYLAGGGGRDVDAPESAFQLMKDPKKPYYKRMDMGPRLAIGGEFGVGTARLTLEAAYEYGFMDIGRLDGYKIHNQCVDITLGLSFMLDNKYWRHY